MLGLKRAVQISIMQIEAVHQPILEFAKAKQIPIQHLFIP